MKNLQARHIGDPHLMDPKVAGLRGYTHWSVHDQQFAAAWERSVPTGDTPVFVYGDICKGNLASWEYALEVMASLPGEKHLILGNHDPAHPRNRNGRKHQAAAREVFASVSTADSIRLGGRTVMQSHYPYSGDHDHTGERDIPWRLRDEGRWLVHAHVHELWLVQGRQINVGWENWRDGFATDNELLWLIERGERLEEETGAEIMDWGGGS